MDGAGFARVCKDVGTTITDVQRKCRRAALVQKRRRVALELSARGVSLSRIAWFLNRDRATVRNLINGKGWRE